MQYLTKALMDLYPKQHYYESRRQYQPERNDIAFLILRRLLHRHLCRVQHIFDKDAVAAGGVVDHNVSHRADKLAVLNDGRARHECGQVGTTVFYKKFIS